MIRLVASLSPLLLPSFLPHPSCPRPTRGPAPPHGWGLTPTVHSGPARHPHACTVVRPSVLPDPSQLPVIRPRAAAGRAQEGCTTKAAMAAAGRGPERDLARFVYVTQFGSHQCGRVWRLGGRAQGRGSPGFAAGCCQEEPRREAAAEPRGGGEPSLGSPPRAPAASSQARPSNARSGPRRAARAGGAKGATAGGRGRDPRLAAWRGPLG